MKLEKQREKVVEIPLSKIHPFENRPFKATVGGRTKPNPLSHLLVDKSTVWGYNAAC
ncbi:MAG: hypothetical protein IJ461_05965 [Clostridia bacterium]|nr:hypothetical protein [Clostridia bacterium]